MSWTDGMNKTPGVRQRNHGWARMVREQRHIEAVARNKAYQANLKKLAEAVAVDDAS